MPDQRLNVLSYTAAGKLLSVVIPFYNERSVLAECLQRLEATLATLGLRYELIFVDDGSTDGSVAFLQSALNAGHALRLIRLSRNFGKEAALSAGLAHARGDAVVVLDADMQDPPELIGTMVDHWQKGADVVVMRRRSRSGESRFKLFCAHVFYRLLNRFSSVDIPVDAGDFRLMSRRALAALLQLNERNRYMKGLFAWVGMPTVVLEYDRAARSAGETKWRFMGLLRLGLDGITSFSIAPLHLATVAGLLSAAIGACFGVWITLKTLLFGDPTSGYPSLIAIMTFLGGVQLLGIGVVGEYIGKIYLETKQRPLYLIREITGDSDMANTAAGATVFHDVDRRVQAH